MNTIERYLSHLDDFMHGVDAAIISAVKSMDPLADNYRTQLLNLLSQAKDPTVRYIIERIYTFHPEVYNNYDTSRKSEYPPIEEFIDGWVKDDIDQMNEYKAKCLAVKAKYPKPE